MKILLKIVLMGPMNSARNPLTEMQTHNASSKTLSKLHLKLGLSSNLLQTVRLKSVHIVGQIMWQNILKVKVC